ncbi:MAG TPA: PQQ-binding-like beta-propeller repeat protein, partial [Planctomycetota bacterium]|nr:PQQ-binding-like beta-propeller repeat protein [Planctomycetota bacterium]
GLLRQYRLTVDGDVERLYEQARLRPDPDELEELAVRCYVSSHGPAMLDFAGDVYAARGESDRAASCWGRLLRWGPSTDVPAELVEAKLVLALVRSGRLRAARRIVDAVNARAPDTQVTLAGERRKAVPYLSAALAGPAGGATRKADDARRAWSQFGGDAAHDRTMPAGFKCDVKVGELLIPGYDWKSPGVPPPPTGPFAFTRATASSGPQPLPYAPFHPVYGGGRVFIHDDRGVMAFRVGAISPDWVVGEMGEPGEAQRGRVVINGVVHVQPGGRGYACAYENGVVYASLHDAPGGREVWAVSEKGTILWRITADREDFGWLADTSELSDPVVFDGRLYFCAWQSDQYGRGCSLVCVDAADGRLNWQRFICSGPIARYYRSGRTPQLPAVTLPAAADGHVVVCSNVGGIAALDARTGELQWGFAYEQTGTQFTAQAFARDKLPTYVPGSSATPLVHQGVVYVAPADAARFYALDLDTGRRLWDTPRGDHDRIVGLIDDRLIVSGRKVAALDATTGGALWVCEGQDAAYAGHGFITTDAVYIPGSECIYRLDPKGGDLLGRLLVDREAGEYGNLLLIEDTVVQVGRRASYYGEWESVHARLAQEVALHPDDPFPQIKLAVIYARREDRRAAIRHFERALELTAGLEDDTTSRLRGEVRRRLYTIYAAEVEAVLDEGRTDVAFPLAVR